MLRTKVELTLFPKCALGASSARINDEKSYANTDGTIGVFGFHMRSTYLLTFLRFSPGDNDELDSN